MDIIVDYMSWWKFTMFRLDLRTALQEVNCLGTLTDPRVDDYYYCSSHTPSELFHCQVDSV